MSAARRPSSAWTTGLLVAGIAASLAVMGWLGVRAVRGWRHSATQLARQHAAEAADRLATVLGRDMRAVQTMVLASAEWDQAMLDSPFDARGLAASAFARYPYPESFFVWRGGAGPASVAFLDRADRRPPWLRGAAGPIPFPVTVDADPDAAAVLLARVGADARQRRRFSIFEATLHGTRYQVVARPVYRNALRDRLQGVVGFTVNLAWVRRHYFAELTRQVARTGGAGSPLRLAVFDAGGTPVAGSPPSALGEPVQRRPLPFAFYDPLLVAVEPPADLAHETWTVAGGGGDDPAMRDAIQGGQWTLLVAGVAVAALLVGLALTARAAQASARLAALRSDFVSAVTHELKTPIAAIRAAGDTMALGRLRSPEALASGASLIVQESRRLGRLVDNLLAYSRIADVTEVYSLEPLDVDLLVGDVLAGFRKTIEAGGFALDVDVPPDIPPIRGDRTACQLLFDNLVDNALRYSPPGSRVAVRARAAGRAVTIEVADNGPGIPADELPKLTRRFFRGRGAGAGGSGLGLTIVNRIAGDHGGALRIESRVGGGTSVSVTLPAAETGDEEADPGR